jgi:hypothetical protein
LERGIDIDSIAFEKADASGRFKYRRVESKAAAVEEVVIVCEANVYPGPDTSRNELKYIPWSCLVDPQSLGKIVPCSGWNYRQGTVAFLFQKFLRDSGTGPVAANNSNYGGALMKGLPSKSRFVPRGFSRENSVLSSSISRGLDCAKNLRGFSTPGCGIDYRDYHPSRLRTND